MKRIAIFFIFSLLFAATASLSGQDDPERAYKDAKSALGKYNLAPQNNKDQLAEARKQIEYAVENIEKINEKKRPQTLLLAGEIYNEMATQDMGMLALDPTHEPKHPDAALHAFSALKGALNKANKGWEKKDAVNGLLVASSNLSNAGSLYFGKKEFGKAYKAFSNLLEAHDLVKQEDADKAPLKSEQEYNDLMFAAAVSASNAENMEKEAGEMFTNLYKKDYEKPAVFEELFKINLEKDEKTALKYLEEGRQKYPNDQGLLYSEINYYIRENKLDNLQDKLKQAIEADPKNISLYTTLGFVDDNLFQKEMEAGNVEAAQKHFDEALRYYKQALEINPNAVDAIYSIGALYYNKAAVMTKELQELEKDYSREGLKKYEAKKKDILGLFDEALPYFKKAESLAPNDRNTLIALKEIFAKKGTPEDLELSNEFKMRLEKLDSEEANEKSYFKNK